MEKKISNNQIKSIISDPKTRKLAVVNSHLLFFHYYFSSYIEYPTADFQKELFAITEDEKEFLSVIIAFRGSAKSTIVGRSYPIWSIVGHQKKKFVVLIAQTQNRTQEIMHSIKSELEENELLNKDLGKFYEKQEPWNNNSLYLPKYQAKITTISSQEAVRGLLFKGKRPDLIIGDDVEDIRSNDQQDIRDKNYRWFKHEILPLGHKKTKIIMIGNMLHEDSLLNRLKKEILANQSNLPMGYYEYPLLDKDGKCLWPGMYNKQDIINLKNKINDERAWRQEYLLEIVSDKNQIIKPEDIHYYDELPQAHLKEAVIGIDPAISQEQGACYTAMVSVYVYDVEGKIKYYVLPNPINERMDYTTTLETAKREYLNLEKTYTNIYVESNAYQESLAQTLQAECFSDCFNSVKGRI